MVEPGPGQPVVLELRCGSADLAPHPLPESRRRSLSEAGWSSWLASLTLPAVATDAVGRSALTLRALCHAGTGAILAAATTSLPEEIGGIRNWDYRHCWLRDAALTAQALVSLGSTGEAEAYLNWVRAVLAGLPGPERLHPVYALDGSSSGSEAVIDTLPGYAGSRPVRVGNLADQQVQLDVFGPVVDLIADLSRRRAHLTDADWELAAAMCQAVARRWHEPDHGIWEERMLPRHHVYSKVMCWLTLDRAIALAGAYGRSADSAWAGLRAAIAADVLEHGWNEEVQAFTAAYDGTDLDAASLHVGLSGLLDPADEQYDPIAERSLGNHPQAYSHLGLIRCARLLAGAED